MTKYLTLNTASEWTCLIIALICLPRDRSLAWKGMIILLIMVCFSETLGIYIKERYLADRLNVRPNTWVYNVLLIFEAGLISIMFSSLFKEYRKLSLVIFSGLSFLTLLYLMELFHHGLHEFNITTQLVMQVLFTFYCFIYYYLMLKDDIGTVLIYDAGFWWVAGTLFFYFGSVMSNLFYETIRDNFPGQNFTGYIFNVLIIMLYGCWSYAFILRKLFIQRSEIPS